MVPRCFPLRRLPKLLRPDNAPKALSGLKCPSWDRTRTLLIQSQACCQLHQGAPKPADWLESTPSGGTRRKIPGVGCAPSTPRPPHGALPLPPPCLDRRSRKDHAGQAPAGPRSERCSLIAGLSGCRDWLSPASGRVSRAVPSVDQLFGALAARHADVSRSAKYAYSRLQHHARGALVPSRVFADTRPWTGVSGSVRVVETLGSWVDGQYALASRAAPGAARPADGRHVITLSLSGNEFRGTRRWTSRSAASVRATWQRSSDG